MAAIDHIVYGALDLESAIAHLAGRLGVVAVPGGKHVGRGTHNALLSLGDSRYLEIIAPDPTEAGYEALPFGLDRLTRSKLVGWAVRPSDLECAVKRSRRLGYDPGSVEDMSRILPDGQVLRWRLTSTSPGSRSVLVPFLITWLGSPHPSSSAPSGATLSEVWAEHPDPSVIMPQLEALGAHLPVKEAAEPALVALVETKDGLVELR